MPKLKTRETPQQSRERAVLTALARCSADKGLRFGQDVAEYLGIGISAFYRHREDSFQRVKYGDMCRYARSLGITGREWCAMAGIPYDE